MTAKAVSRVRRQKNNGTSGRQTGTTSQLLLRKAFPSFSGMAFQLMKLTATSPEPFPKQLTPPFSGEFVLCTYPAWTRMPMHYGTSMKNQEIQILLTTLLSLWTLRDMPDGKVNS